jgi:hypothetical protein
MNRFPNLTTNQLDLVEIQQSHLKDIFLLFTIKERAVY